MKVTFVGGESGNGGSPRVYETDRGSLIVQGWIVDDAEALAQLAVPGGETVVEIPSALARFMPRAGDDSDGVAPRA